jgi:hypothetical protein
MSEQKFNNLINIMKKQKLTDSEKSAIWFKVETFVENNPVNSNSHSKSGIKKSPYFARHHFFTAGKILATSFLLVILGFGGLSYSSASALPGDLLYSLKINVKEKVEEQLTFNTEKKIELRQKRIETRFTEVESLIQENKITKENRETVEKNIQAEKEKITKNLAEIKETNPEMAELAKIKIEKSIKNHQEKINILVKDRNQNKLESNKQEQTKENNTENKTETIKPELENKLETATQETQEIIPEVTKTEAVTTEEAKTAAIMKTEETLLINNIKLITDSNASILSSDEIDESAAN